MKIIHMIDDFAGSIYFEDTDKLKERIISICEELTNIYTSTYPNNNEKLEQLNDLLNGIYIRLKSNDYILMSDYLLYIVKPTII